jgi:hypothetical protein
LVASKSKSSVATAANMKIVLVLAVVAIGLAASSDLENFESYQKHFNKVYKLVPFVGFGVTRLRVNFFIWAL